MNAQPAPAEPDAGRRRLIAGWPLLFGGAWLASPSVHAQAQLPLADSLRNELAAALDKRRALVAMVSLDHCPYCRLVRDAYLAPLHRQGQPVVQLDMRSPRTLTDFAGTRTTHGELVKSLDARVAPTVLFFGRGGAEAAPRLAGMVIPDFYGAYLQERVDAANRSLLIA